MGGVPPLQGQVGAALGSRVGGSAQPALLINLCRLWASLSPPHLCPFNTPRCCRLQRARLRDPESVPGGGGQAVSRHQIPQDHQHRCGAVRVRVRMRAARCIAFCPPAATLAAPHIQWSILHPPQPLPPLHTSCCACFPCQCCCRVHPWLPR